MKAMQWTYLSVRLNADEERFVFFMEDRLKLDSILYFKLEQIFWALMKFLPGKKVVCLLKQKNSKTKCELQDITKLTFNCLMNEHDYYRTLFVFIVLSSMKISVKYQERCVYEVVSLQRIQSLSISLTVVIILLRSILFLFFLPSGQVLLQIDNVPDNINQIPIIVLNCINSWHPF